MPSVKELERQYRLARQMLAMHHAHKDSLNRRAKLAESVLLVASVVFCATTFASDELYHLLGIDPERSRLVLGLASVSAFAAALLSMLFDWRGEAARHQDAAERWEEVVRLFREGRSDNGTWSEGEVELSAAFWQTTKSTRQIPDRKFNRLKARYLAKVELSKKLDEYPGASLPLLWTTVWLRGTWKLAKDELGADRPRGSEDNQNEKEALD